MTDREERVTARNRWRPICFVMTIVLVLAFSPFSAAAEEDRYLKLDLSYEGGAIMLADSVVMPGRAMYNGPAQGGMRAELLSAKGEVLSSVTFANPGLEELEYADPDGRLDWVATTADSARLSLRLPYVEGAESVRFVDIEGSVLGVDDLFDENRKSSPPPAWNAVKVVDNGASSNRIDVLYLGDGYTSSQLSTLATHVTSGYTYLTSQEPWASYAGYLNIWRVDVISTQSGADDPINGVYVNTALDSSYMWDGYTDRLLYSSSTKVYDAATLVPATDTILVTVNHTKYGGGGGSFSVYAGGNATAVDIALHELGHSFGGLADEYHYSDGSTYSGGELSQVNVTKYNKAYLQANNHKWYYWIGLRGIDVFEGAQYYQYGKFRPHNNCEMKALTNAFCAVCEEEQILDIYRIVRPIDSVVPPTNPTIGPGQSQVFTVATPTCATLVTTWFLDGVPQAVAGPSFQVFANLLTPGPHSVTVQVADTTSKVLNDPTGLLTDQRSWILTVTGGSCPDNDGDGFQDWTCGGLDCDDADANTFPGAPEICDGKDNDCDGVILPHEADIDMDGWMACLGDCNDHDPNMNPLAPEIPGDGIDWNCNGQDDCFLMNVLTD